MNHLFDIVRGDFADEGKSHFEAYGHNGDVGGSFETVYSQSDRYTFLTGAERLQVASDSADDGLAGTGAQKATITGLDGNYAEIEEEVDLDGTNNSTTDASFLRVNGFYVSQAGSGAANAGTVTVSNNADDNVLAAIEPGEGEAHNGVYTVPAGKTGYVVQWHAMEASNKVTYVSLAFRMFGEATRFKRGAVLNQDVSHLSFQLPLPVPEKSDIELVCRSSATGADVVAGFEGWIE